MPTKRRRVKRRVELSADELAWLTGEPQDGTTALWAYRQWLPGRLDRLRSLLESHAHLVPPGRLPELERDLDRWSPYVPRGLASFR